MANVMVTTKTNEFRQNLRYKILVHRILLNRNIHCNRFSLEALLIFSISIWSHFQVWSKFILIWIIPHFVWTHFYDKINELEEWALVFQVLHFRYKLFMMAIILHVQRIQFILRICNWILSFNCTSTKYTWPQYIFKEVLFIRCAFKVELIFLFLNSFEKSTKFRPAQ